MIEFDKWHGQYSRMRKLTEEQIRDIRRRFNAGEDPAEIGKRYKITRKHAWRIGKRLVWKFLKD